MKPLDKETYPKIERIKSCSFNSFVAYDLETTGLFSERDAIIEIGAVKVIDGQIVDTFQEFVRPYKSYVSPTITRLTGITPNDVKDAREMWEVVPDFMNFVGDHILLGFNNTSFDNKFLIRALRYSHIIINNKSFDVLYFARHCKMRFNFPLENTKLNTVANYLNIENPRAHRALADALTTAKVYLTLKNLYDKNKK